jgi:hypothetical protein
MLIPYVLFLILSGSLVMIVARSWRARHLDRWLFSYLRQAMSATSRRPGSPVHLILCIADHFEPGNGRAPAEQASGRVEQWIENYPRLFEQFRDSDGKPPRHTFFYPLERYLPAEVDALADLCRQGYGEVEVHLHHDKDHAEALRERLNSYKEMLALKHGLLARDRETGELKYGFIHGNWALDNSHPDGRNCGVDNELDILRETGCYADFTMPSASHPTQTRTINSIYYAVDDPANPKSHDRGVPVGVGTAPSNGLMLIQGPLVLDWGRRKWGLVPRIENGCIQSNQPASIERIRAWLNAAVQVSGRPDWYFVKLHTHGAPEWNQKVLLGEPMVQFHRDLALRAQNDPNFQFHYVTAREMYNLVRAAEAGWRGTVDQARDHRLICEDWRVAQSPSLIGKVSDDQPLIATGESW